MNIKHKKCLKFLSPLKVDKKCKNDNGWHTIEKQFSNYIIKNNNNDAFNRSGQGWLIIDIKLFSSYHEYVYDDLIIAIKLTRYKKTKIDHKEKNMSLKDIIKTSLYPKIQNDFKMLGQVRQTLNKSIFLYFCKEFSKNIIIKFDNKQFWFV